MNQSMKTSLSLAAAMAVSAISANAALIADYATDFTLAANPTPTGWSYLFAGTVNGVVTPTSADPIIGSTLDRSNLSPFEFTPDGYWRHEDVGVGSQTVPWNYIQLNATEFHPGSGNTGPVINYSTIAAYTGVTLDYEFTNRDNRGTGVELVVFVNDVVTHISTTADGSTVSATLSLPDLPAGEDVTIWFNNLGDNGYAGSDIGNITLNGTAVPEPSTTALLGLGGIALILRRRK